MEMDDLILVSVDDHVIEPPNMFEDFMPAKYLDRAPKLVTDDVGEKWVFGEGEARNVGLNAVAGRVPEEYGLEPTTFKEIRIGCFDVDERVKDMNANGVLGSLNFPSMARFCGQFFASRAQQDPDLALAVLQAYNDWHIDAWCGAYPERFIPCTIPPIWDPELMAAEVHRTAAKGSHCVSFSMNPHALGLPSLHGDHWDPFWAACDETDTVVTLHIGSGGLEVHDVTGRTDERAHHLLGHQHLPHRGRPGVVPRLPEVQERQGRAWPKVASAGSPTSSSASTTPTSTTRRGPSPTSGASSRAKSSASASSRASSSTSSASATSTP